ncbi:MAG: CoA-binding protein [Balneolales bacterium]
MKRFKSMDFRKLLTAARNIVIIGCSAEPNRTSYGIAAKLKSSGYAIMPVNPNYEEILGEKCYDDMRSVPGDIKVDIVVIFRNKAYTGQMVRSIADWSEKSGQKPVIWTQLDVSSPEAEDLALEHDLPYVRNHCIAVEYAKNVG